ncbi:hypothetical protein EGI20_12405 [Aquitalea sp. S1-19]|nr:hypothetical protein [Aquitalea sp. S1-19]
MGSSVTFCYCKRIVEFMPFGKTLEKRTALYGITKEYLEEPGCVAGVAANVQGVNAYADALGLYYLALLRSELAEHGGNDVESLSSMKGLSIVFAEMWAEASRALESNSEVASFDLSLMPLKVARQPALDVLRIQAVCSRIDATHRIPAERQFAYDYGSVLAKAYSKSLVELQTCAPRTDKAIIKHHCALLGDLLDEMLDLVQNPYEGNPGSEHALPTSHPHAIGL